MLTDLPRTALPIQHVRATNTYWHRSSTGDMLRMHRIVVVVGQSRLAWYYKLMHADTIYMARKSKQTIKFDIDKHPMSYEHLLRQRYLAGFGSNAEQVAAQTMSDIKFTDWLEHDT